MLLQGQGSKDSDEAMLRHGFACVYSLIILYIISTQSVFLATQNSDSAALAAAYTVVIVSALQLILFHWAEYLGPRLKNVMQINPDNQYNSGATVEKASLLEELLPIGTAAVSCGHLLTQVIVVGACTSTGAQMFNACNPHHDSGGVPADSLLIAVLLPLLHLMMPLRSTSPGGNEKLLNIDTVVIQTAVVVIYTCSLALCAISLPILALLALIIISILLSALLLQVNWKMKHLLRCSHIMVQESLQRQKQDMSAHNQEMRHMIANVAHDLKTPLTSYMSGVDNLNLILDDIRHMAAGKDLTPSACIEQVDLMNTCLESMRNTSSFMIMAINRCIDFTKASSGVVLKPSFETFNLMTVLSMPIKVIRDLQTRLTVNFEVTNQDCNICPYVVTDKQWVQENMLCLLSNAVKYTNKGAITVRVSLRDAEALKERYILRARGGVPKEEPQRKTSAEHVPPTAQDNQGKRWYRFRLFQAKRGRSALIADFESEMMVHSFRRASNMRAEHMPSNSNTDSTFTRSWTGSGVASFNFLDSCAERSINSFAESSISKETSFAIGNKLEFIVIEVEDTGIGLSDEAAASLFSPFKQAQRLAGGTGLGLYSLAKRMDALRGQYGVKSRDDGQKGSVFWFAFPYRPDEAMRDACSTGNAEIIIAQQAYSQHVSAQPLNDDKLTILKQQHLHPQPGIGVSATITRSRSDLDPCCKIKSSDDKEEEKSEHHNIDETEPCVELRPPTTIPITEDVAQKSVEIPGRCALVVDDSLSILKMTSMVLKRQGYSVTTAENGADALEIILSRYKKLRLGTDVAEESVKILNNGRYMAFDVVLMDLQMPVMDGIEAVRRLREEEKRYLVESGFSFRQVVVCASANSDYDTRQSAMTAGADAFLHKPFSFASFQVIYDGIIS